MTRFTRTTCALLGLLSALVGSRVASATTVIEKDLDALSAEADRVFVGTVAAIESAWADTDQRYIASWVTFDRIDPLLGVGSPEVTLRFSGGQIGDLVQHVQGLPQLAVGDRVVIFARDGNAVSPLVGFHQGCLRVDGDGDAAVVITNTYQRIGTSSDGQQVITDARVSTVSRPLSEFLVDVRQRLSTRRGVAP